jgi:transglutaminase-like putative cysteine protease
LRRSLSELLSRSSGALFEILMTHSWRLSLLSIAVLFAGCQPGTHEAVAKYVHGKEATDSGSDSHAGAATRTFTFRYETAISAIPDNASTAYLWIPSPMETEDQVVSKVRIESELEYEIVRDPKHLNQAYRFVVPPGTKAASVVLHASVTRNERIRRPLSDEADSSAGQITAGVAHAATGKNGFADDVKVWLEPDRLIPISEQIRSWAEETTEGAQTPAAQARAIYNYAVNNLKYDKSGTGWGQGNIYWACDEKRGNCTDFHALIIGYSRAMGIPARFEMGFPIPVDRGEGEIGGYHCWAQLFVEGQGWLPVDASEAFKHPEKREYFFGAHDENRILFTYGRDLTFPGMQGNPLNYFIYPYAEVDGKPHVQLTRKFSYEDAGEL